MSGQKVRRLGIVESMNSSDTDVAEERQPDGAAVQQGTLKGEDAPSGNGIVGDQEDLLVWD
jgi:hypothetical protein